MAAKRKTKEKWIEEVIADPDHEHKLSMISLVHMRGANPVEIHTWKPGGAHGADPKKLAELFTDKAATFSQDLPGTQTFNLLAFYGSTDPKAQMPFVVRVEADVHSSGLTTEAPTDAGRLQQAMRWAEMGQGQVYRRQQVQDDFGIRMMQMQQGMIERLAADRFDALNVMTDMMMRQANNAHELRMKELEYERSSQERAALMKLAPALVNTIAGNDVFPKSTADTALIEQIAGAITPEIIPKLLELGLPDVVVAPLMKRFQQVQEEKQKTAQATAALPAYKGSPTDDIRGGGG